MYVFVAGEPLSASVVEVRDAIAALSRSPISMTAQIVRPSNTTAYAANDVICSGGSIHANGISVGETNPGSHVILSARLVDRANQSSKLAADLWLFSEPLTNAMTDNAPFDPALNDMDNFIDVISFGVTDAIAIGSVTIYRIAPRTVILLAQSLYGVLVARNAYIPVSGEKFDVSVGFLPQNSVIS